jgi:hypothetical protein
LYFCNPLLKRQEVLLKLVDNHLKMIKKFEEINASNLVEKSETCIFAAR